MLIHRTLSKSLEQTLNRGKSILLLRPRQTGKTTLIKTLKHDRYLNLMDINLSMRYRTDPSIFFQEMRFLAQRQKKSYCNS